MTQKIFITICLSIWQVKSDQNTIQLSVVTPQSLNDQFQNKDVQLANANFGQIPDGKSVVGKLFLASNIKACIPIDPILEQYSFILVAIRGECTFVQKARYAQMAGAKMLLLVDSEIESENYITLNGNDADDITIPTTMISHDQGLVILDQMKKTNVVLEFKFPGIPVAQELKIQLWISSSDYESYDYISYVKMALEEIGGLYQIIPRYIVQQGDDYFSTQEKSQHCVSSGNYCAPSFDAWGAQFSGRNAVLEDLYQYCLFTLFPSEWSNYMNFFYNQCLYDEDQIIDFNCSQKIAKMLSVDHQVVKKCVDDSFIIPGNYETNNQKLRGFYNKMIERNIVLWPTMMINGFIINTNVYNYNQLRGVLCEAYNESTQYCKDRLTNQQIQPQQFSMNHTGIYILIFFISILIFFVAVFLWRRKTQQKLNRDVQTLVNAQVSQYYALDR